MCRKQLKYCMLHDSWCCSLWSGELKDVCMALCKSMDPCVQTKFGMDQGTRMNYIQFRQEHDHSIGMAHATAYRRRSAWLKHMKIRVFDEFVVIALRHFCLYIYIYVYRYTVRMTFYQRAFITVTHAVLATNLMGAFVQGTRFSGVSAATPGGWVQGSQIGLKVRPCQGSSRVFGCV